MISIWKKELRGQLFSVTGFLYLSAALFLFGLYFYLINLYSGIAHVSYAYASCVYLFVVTIPILTMRSFAQEFRDRTDQFLFTAPVSLWDVVLGKYLAMLTLFLLPVLIAAVFPLLLLGYGSVAVSEAYLTLFAYTLYGMAAIAIGMFLSSLTESTVVSAVLTAIILFLAYTMGGFGELTEIPVLRELLHAFHMQNRFLRLEAGILDIRSILYFLSVAAGFTALTVFRLRQKQGGGEPKKWIFPGAVVVMVVLVNVLAAVLPDSAMEHDLTSKDYQQITETTKQFLNRLDQDVKIFIYSKEETADVNVVKTLRNYTENPHIRLEYVNPELSPRFTEKYSLSGLEENSLIVQSDTRFRTIPYSGIYTYSDSSMEEYGMDPDCYDLEGQLTSALDYVTTDRIPKIYQITGHGEQELMGDFLKAVQRENVDLETLSLVSAGEVPQDAQCVLILSAVEDYSEEEIRVLKEYLDRGGNLYMLLRWEKEPPERLYSLLAGYGIRVMNGVVSEQDAKQYFQTPYYLIPEIRNTSVTEGLEGSIALSVMTVGLKAEAEEVQPILLTSDQAYLKTDPDEDQEGEWEPGDERGEYALGLCLDRKVELPAETEGAAKVSRQSRIVVFGSAFMTQDAIDTYISGMNRKLFAKILSSLVSHLSPVSIPAKSYLPQYVTVSRADSAFFGVILAGILPGALLITGVMIRIIRGRR